MRIILSEEYYSADFASFLLEQLKLELMKALNMQRVIAWDAFINNQHLFFNASTKSLSAINIINNCIFNIEIYDKSKYFQLEINPKLQVPGSTANLAFAGKVMDQGVLDMPGLYLFSTIFSHFSENLQYFKNEYDKQNL